MSDLGLGKFLVDDMGYKLEELYPNVLLGLTKIKSGRFTLQGDPATGKSFLGELAIARFIIANRNMTPQNYGMSGDATVHVLVTTSTSGMLKNNYSGLFHKLQRFGPVNEREHELIFGNLTIAFRKSTPECILGLNIVAALMEDADQTMVDQVWRRMESRRGAGAQNGLLISIPHVRGSIISL